ncbi:hypothetical protein LEP1GSC041_2898 [Leptospira noguchii str. 2006001870]|nr:hypothetical protein LEP1GSC041_2898 [Leptospira noguchii str. 2006001870]
MTLDLCLMKFQSTSFSKKGRNGADVKLAQSLLQFQSTSFSKKGKNDPDIMEYSVYIEVSIHFLFKKRKKRVLETDHRVV